MIDIFQYLPLFLIIRLLLTYNKRKILDFIGLGIGIWFWVEAVKGILQLMGVRASNHAVFMVTGSFDNPGPFGGFLAVVGTIAITYLITNRDRCSSAAKYSCISIAALLVLLLPASMSRAAWLAFCVAVFLCVMLEFDAVAYIKKHKILTTIGLTILILLAAGSFCLKKDSALGRLHIWKIELLAIADNPIEGYGKGTVLGVYGDTQARYFMGGEGSERDIIIAGCPEYAFNELLKIGIERGVIAMVLVLFLVLLCLLRLFTVSPPFAFGMVALCIFSMFSYPLSLWQFRILFVIFIALALQNTSDNKALVRIDGILSVILIGFILCFSNGHYDSLKSEREAIAEWKNIRTMASFEIYDEMVDGLEPLLPVLKGNFRYLYDYGYALHKCGKYVESNWVLEMGAEISSDPMFHNIMGKNYEELGLFVDAKERYEYAHYMVPSRLYPLVLLEELHLKLGEFDQAKRVLDTINAKYVNKKNRAMIDLRKRANNSYNIRVGLCKD